MDQLQGQDLKQAFSAATARLQEYRDTINTLNVFPVPDGDTGTNMLLTMRSAVQSATEGCPDGQDGSVALVSSALAQGAFFGARGNSGVILSQFFKGFSDALTGKESLVAHDLALAFSLASNASYKSVGDPVEGTMLSVIRMASEAIQGAMQGSVKDVLGLWQTAFHASQDALDRTPEQLPVLREAGVVDAGGLGIVVLIGGALQSFSAENSAVVDLSSLSRFQRVSNINKETGLVEPGYLKSTLEQEWGHCIQFIVSAAGDRNLDPDRVRSHFQKTALSTVVVGDEQNIRVHIHSEDPSPAINYAESLGVLSEVKIEDMDSQSRSLASGVSGQQTGQSTASTEGAALELLPVATGEGLAGLFLDSGCASVIEGGQTMNPSIGQILEAARNTGAKDVIVLPNNGNVVLAAEQAAAAESFLHVVATTSIPQGVAALLAYNPEGTWEENIAAMNAALTEVASVGVTSAVRGVEIGGVEVADGQFIGLLEGQIVAAVDSPEAALIAALDKAGLSAEAIVTIFYGAGAAAVGAEAAAAELKGAYPGIQVDLIDGGQPHYHYLGSVE